MSPSHPILVFPDGVRFADLQAAIQAAWLANDRPLARELAGRYDLYNQLCLCCANAHISASVMPSTAGRVLGEWLYQLCDHCIHDEVRGRVKPFTLAKANARDAARLRMFQRED